MPDSSSLPAAKINHRQKQKSSLPKAQNIPKAFHSALSLDIKEMIKLPSSIGRNINQIGKRVNAGGPTYQADMEEIRERLDQIWQLQRRILLSQH